jgi:hypothetical protein
MAQIDLKQYQKSRDAGHVRLARMDKDRVVLSVDTFDPSTGAAVDPSTENFSIRELIAQRDSVQAHMDNLNAFIADMEALVPVAPVAPK